MDTLVSRGISIADKMILRYSVLFVCVLCVCTVCTVMCVRTVYMWCTTCVCIYHAYSCAHAEFVFKVSDDFSNFIQIFTAAVEVARDFIIKYGR